MSHTARVGSIAISTAPSATNTCDQKSPIPRVRHAVERIELKAFMREPKPTKSEYATDASVMDETCDTANFLLLPLKVTKAPSQHDACHRRASAGELAIPTTTSCVPSSATSTSAINVAHVGTPRIKFLVPSMGSITQ